MEDDLAGLRFDIDEEDAYEVRGGGHHALSGGSRSRGERRAPGGRGGNAVCIHYLVGMCALDKECPFLHQYDYDKIPICPYGSKCIRDVDCPYKHVSDEDKTECLFFRQGFCMYGPFCRYRHIHRNPEECPEEADFHMNQGREMMDDMPLEGPASGGMHSHAHSGGGLGGPPHMHRSASSGGSGGVTGGGGSSRSRRPGGALERNENYKTTLCNHWRDNNGMCPFGEDCVFAHGEAELRKHPLAIAREQAAARRGLAAASVPPGPPIPAPHEVRFAELGTPLQDNWRVRYFVIKSLNYKNLAQSVRRGLWRTHRNNERLLNEAFRQCDKVVLFFSVNESGHWQGVATMVSPIRPQPHLTQVLALPQHPQDGWTAEFAVEWLRLVSLPFPHTRPLRNPLNENLPISRSRDCQELTPEIGRQLIYLMYNSPEQPLTMGTPQAGAGHGLEASPLGLGGGPSMLEGLGPMDPLYLEPFGLGAVAGGGRDFPIFPGPGFLFGASQEYLEECLVRGLFGLPAGGVLEEQVKEVVVPGTTLFLSNASNRTILGIFEAASQVQFNAEPQAWVRGPMMTNTSPYPLQVRFRCLLEAPPVSESDPEVRSILGPLTPSSTRGMGGGRAGALSDDQAQRLANLLASRAGALMGPPGGAPPLGRHLLPPSPIMRPTHRQTSSSSLSNAHTHATHTHLSPHAHTHLSSSHSHSHTPEGPLSRQASIESLSRQASMGSVGGDAHTTHGHTLTRAHSYSSHAHTGVSVCVGGDTHTRMTSSPSSVSSSTSPHTYNTHPHALAHTHSSDVSLADLHRYTSSPPLDMRYIPTHHTDTFTHAHLRGVYDTHMHSGVLATGGGERDRDTYAHAHVPTALSLATTHTNSHGHAHTPSSSPPLSSTPTTIPNTHAHTQIPYQSRLHASWRPI